MSGRAWFVRRRYGWGLKPASWQGWAVTAAYAVAVIAFAVTLAHSQPWIFVTLIVISTALYFLVATLTRGDR